MNCETRVTIIFMTARLYILLLILLGLLVWGNTIFNQLFISDDEDQIINNVLIRDISNIPKIFSGSTYYREESGKQFGLFYRPLMLSVYTLLYQMHGPDPLVFHLFQLLVHIGSSVLLFIILKEFIDDAWSFAGASLFLVHPMASDVVLHAANLQDALMLFFGLLSYIVASQKQLWRAPFLLFLFLLTVFSKESGLIFLVFIPLSAVLFPKRNILLVSICSLVAFGIYIFFRFYIAHLSFGVPESIAIIASEPLWLRLFSVPRILVTALADICIGLLGKDGGYWMVRPYELGWIFGPLLLLGIVFVLVITAGKILATKGLLRPFLLFVLLAVISIFPHMQIIPLDATYASRWYYPTLLASISIVVLILSSCRWSKVTLSWCFFLVTVLGIFYATRSSIRTFDWRNSETLLTHDIAVGSTNYYAENLLASIYIRNGAYDKALPLVEDSLRQKPFVGNWSNRAILAMHAGNLLMAEQYFQKAASGSTVYQAVVNYASFLLSVKKDASSAAVYARESRIMYPNSDDLKKIFYEAEYIAKYTKNNAVQ